MYLNDNEKELYDETKPSYIAKFNKQKLKLQKSGLDSEYKLIRLVRDIRFKNKHNTFTALELEHSCGCKFHMRPDKFFNQGLRCPDCNSGNNIYTYEKIKKIVENDTDFEYLLISVPNKERFVVRDEIEIYHRVCNSYSKVELRKFIERPRCRGECLDATKSVGERTIRYLLDEEDIEYSYPYIINECKNIRVLPFDFEITGKIIEFDGKTHFKKRNDDKNGEKFKLQQYRDNIKTKYCIDNNLTLIRIPYTIENDLDSIIQSILDGSYLEDTRLFILQNGKLHNQPELYDYLLNEMEY